MMIKKLLSRPYMKSERFLNACFIDDEFGV